MTGSAVGSAEEREVLPREVVGWRFRTPEEMCVLLRGVYCAFHFIVAALGVEMWMIVYGFTIGLQGSLEEF
jgi:hypothetical protein